MNLFTVKGIYECHNDNFNVEMNVFAKDQPEAELFFYNNITFAQAFEDGYWHQTKDQIISCMRDIKVETFDDAHLKGKDLSFNIPLIGGEHFASGFGNWEELKTRIPNIIDDDFRRLVEVCLDVPGDSNYYVLFMENPKYQRSTANAILSCVSRGIDPFGH